MSDFNVLSCWIESVILIIQLLGGNDEPMDGDWAGGVSRVHGLV